MVDNAKNLQEHTQNKHGEKWEHSGIEARDSLVKTLASKAKYAAGLSSR